MKLIITTLFLAILTGMNAQVLKLTFDGNTRDTSGYGNHATNNGAVLTTNRFNKANSAYQFDGVNDYMTVANSFDLPNRTFKIWLLTDSLSGITQSAFASDNPALQHGMTAAAILSTTGNFLRTIAGNNIVDNIVTAHTWHMVTITVKGDSFWCYIDSTQVGARINNKHKSGDGQAKLVIGSSRNTMNQYWWGKLDDMTIWDSYMTPQQVKNLYIVEAGAVLGISNVAQPIQKVYPNPFVENLSIELESPSEVELTTLTGDIVYSGLNLESLQKLNTEHLAKGMYILKVRNQLSTQCQLLTKE
jgi:hypothetical protein